MHAPSINLVRSADNLSDGWRFVRGNFVVNEVLPIRTKIWAVDVRGVKIYGGDFRVRRDGESA